MRSNFVFLLLSFLLVGCKNKESRNAEESCNKESNKKVFNMYKMSEMSLLMEQMYVDNKRLAKRIKEGDTIGTFPQYFLKIYNASMTDPREDDLFFREHAKQFIETQELIYQDTSNAKTHFNKAIDACIQCHETKCGGPITRIKKLYIQ